eukprot:CAMPEP_0194485878 /NCGR_PEP_ID=MMETSP0253-20130528/6727_1 /TAXON_ID=2966 /ORGANISM="Noctiluca scintillans" /LENGTH=1972 /DNA_ID=CAMNT_0039325899 /DNA_START=10 /DNA_END=5925 /DNA_ORIENTATION=+
MKHGIFLVIALSFRSVHAIRPSRAVHFIQKMVEKGKASFDEVTTDKVAAYPLFSKAAYPRFPQPWVIDENRKCTGYLFTGCVWDTQVAVRFEYKDHVEKVDQVPMAPDVCFNFCKNVSGAQFFALENGRDCFCTPFFQNQAKGGEGRCDTVCEGDKTQFCGGLRKASVYSMHDCLNTPPSKCQQPPSLVRHAKVFPSIAYLNRSTPCGNLRLGKADTGHGNDHCDVQCLEGHTLTNNTLRCALRGDPLKWTWGQFVGSAACEPVSCGVSPGVPNATHSQRVVRYGPEGHVTYTCLTGHTLNGTANGSTQFTVGCQADGTFTAVSSCLPVDCGSAPAINHAVASAEAGVFNDVITYTVESGFQATDGSTKLAVSCTSDGEWAPFHLVGPILMPFSTCGSPLAFSTASLISDVMFVEYPNQVFYKCHDGYSLDGKWGNASNVSYTNMRFASSCTLDGFFSVLENPCVPVSCGVAPVVGMATSISVVSSVSGDTSHFGLDVVGLASLSTVSLVSGEVAHYVCHHGHTVDGNAASSASFSTTCSSNGTFAPEPPASCQPVVCPQLPVVPNTLPLATSVSTGPFLFGDTSPVFTCKPGYSTNIDDFKGVDTTFSFFCDAHGGFDVVRECVNVDDCLESDCGAGVCEDLVDPSGSNATEHYSCVCDAGYADTVVGGTHRTCLNNCSFGYEIVEGKGCEEINECLLYGGNAACSPGTCHNDIGAYSCTCPSGYESVEVDGKPVCRIVVCGVAPEVKYAFRNDTGKIPYGHMVHYSCDVGYTIEEGVSDAPTQWTVSCDAGGAFGAVSSCHPLKCTVPSVANSELPKGDFFYGETVTFACNEGYSVDGRASGSTSLSAVCGADGEVNAVGECKPISCGEPTFVQNSVVDNKEYVFPEIAAYECQTGYTTTGLASGSTTFTSACGATGILGSTSFCRAVSCGVYDDVNGTASPPDQLSYPASAIVTCNTGHTTVEGDPYGASTYSVSCGSDGNLSYTSVSCAPVSFELRHYCVSDGAHCTADICCAGFSGSGGETFPCADADPSNHGCGTSRNINLYNASTMRFSTIAYDLLTLQAPEGLTRTGELRFTEALWYGGKPYDLLLHAVDDDGNVISDSPIKEVYNLEQVVHLTFDKNTEQSVRFSVVSEGTDDVVTLPELYMTMLDIDCLKDDTSCEILVTEDHNEHIAGDEVNVVQEGTKITATAKSHLNGEGNPETTDLTDEQKSHSLTLGFQNKSSFTIKMTIGDVYSYRAIMFSGISTQMWEEQTTSILLPVPEIVYPPTECEEAPVCLPVICVPEARANSTPSSSTSVAFGAAETWTCKAGHSVDGTPTGKTSFNLPCLATGLFAEVDHEGHLDCMDIDYCSRDPCGSDGQCFDCSTQDCSGAGTEKSFLQRRGIIGGSEFEATDDYACWCHEHFLTTVGPNGELTCQADCKDHSCGVGGSCVDLSIVDDVSSESDLRFTCSCYWGYELIQNGGSDGRDTCSPISCGSVSVEQSDALSSAELFAGDSLLVTCDPGYSFDQTPAGTSFEVTCTETRALSGVSSCSKIYCDNPHPVSHATTTGSYALYGESLTYTCNEGYSHGSIGASFFSVACGADGKFVDTSACEAVQCGLPSFPNVAVYSAANMFFGQNAIGYCNSGYATSQGHHYFTFSCDSKGSFSGVESCDVVTCAVPSMTNVHVSSNQSLTYGRSLTVYCDNDYYVDTLTSFTITCQADGLVSGVRSCTRTAFTVSGTITNQSRMPVQGAAVTISGFTVTSEVDGYYSISDIPQGSHTMEVVSSGYITSSASLWISGDTSHNPSLYQELAVNQWRWTLEWNSLPYDLDSHVHLGQNLSCAGTTAEKDVEPCSSSGSCHAYFPHRGSRYTCASTCTEQGYWDGDCQRASVVLSNDDADGNGPETVFLENVGQCDGDIKDCMLVYEVKNYEWQTSGMDGAGWVVKMYNEQGLQHEKHQPSGVSSSTVWYVVFTMNLKTGKVCDGW